jgi:hypothetical protein
VAETATRPGSPTMSPRNITRLPDMTAVYT